MTARGDFRLGYRVENSYGARGVVTQVTASAVHVEFEDRGKTWDGVFDDEWFEKYGAMLKRIS